MSRNIFILEDDVARKAKFLTEFKEDNVIISESVGDAQTWLMALRFAPERVPNTIFLDHDLGENIVNTGQKFVEILIEDFTDLIKFNIQIIIHSMNPVGAKLMEKTLIKAGYNNVRRVPFNQLFI